LLVVKNIQYHWVWSAVRSFSPIKERTYCWSKEVERKDPRD